MKNNLDISLIIPAYNERAVISGTVTSAADYFRRRGSTFEIIVAADGDDGTREMVTALGRENPAIQVLGEPARRGKGRGIREAMAQARGRIVGFVDADNKVSIEEFDHMEPWFGRGYDLVIGSRAMDESRIERRQPLYRRIGSQGFRLIMNAIVGLPGITDSQCGFKFFTREAGRELFRLQQVDGYMFDVEILAIAQRLGYRVKQVPIGWRDDGDSRLQLLRGNLQNMVDLFRIRAAVARLEVDIAPAKRSRTMTV